MERLDALLLSLQALLLNPMLERLVGIFDLNGRFSVVFIGILSDSVTQLPEAIESMNSSAPLLKMKR